MNILHDKITATLNDAKGVIYVTVPYKDGEDTREAELVFDYSERQAGMYGEHPDTGGGVEVWELNGVNFVAIEGYAPDEINKLANAGAFDVYAEKAWGG